MSKAELARQVVPAHNELDEWAVPRDGMNLVERIRWLGQRYGAAIQRAVELEKARDAHVPDYPPEHFGGSEASE